MNVIRTAWRKPSMSNSVPSPAARAAPSAKKGSRFTLARLHAELSRCRYSLHGLLALIVPCAGAVCQLLIVVENWTPGSAHSQAACAIWRNRSRAGSSRVTSPVVRARNCQIESSSTAAMNSSDRRTELLAFWYCTENESAPSIPMSKPEAANARALRSSRALHHTKASMSGWSASSSTILAARRVLPPLRMVPADASAPRMKLTGPLASPPPESSSHDARMADRLTPAPEPPLKILPSVTYQSRIESMSSSTDRMKQADACCGTPSTPMLNHTGLLKAAR